MPNMNGAHPYQGITAALATKHAKEKVVAPVFASLGISLQVPDIDTDLLGTFSGEIERVGTPKEVALKKARMGMKASGLAYGAASEGSIGPDPVVPFLNSDIQRNRYRQVSLLKSELPSWKHGDMAIACRQQGYSDGHLQELSFPKVAISLSPAFSNRMICAKM